MAWEVLFGATYFPACSMSLVQDVSVVPSGLLEEATSHGWAVSRSARGRPGALSVMKCGTKRMRMLHADKQATQEKVSRQNWEGSSSHIVLVIH